MLFLLLSFVDDFIYRFHSIFPLWGIQFHVNWWEEAKTDSFESKDHSHSFNNNQLFK